jgi:hypothetical protein
MGFMTELSILNDRWSEILQDPKKFVNEVYEASVVGKRHNRFGYVTGQTTVLPAHHADDMRVLYAARNSFFDAYPERGMDKRQLELHLACLKRMAEYIKMAKKTTEQDLEMFKGGKE